MSDDSKRFVLMGEGTFHPNTAKQEFLAKRQAVAEQSAQLPPARSDTPPAPSFNLERIQKKREEIARKYEEGGKPDGTVFIATGPTVPTNTYGGSTPIVDPSWGFKPGVTEFAPGKSSFTNTVFTPTDPHWAKTKFGSYEEHREATKAVLSENASGGHALFRVTPDGVGHLGKHDPMLSTTALRERIDHGTILGIPSGAPTKSSSRFDSFAAFNESERLARAQAAALKPGDEPMVGAFKGSASFKQPVALGKDIGTSVVKSGGTYTTSRVQNTTVTLNSPSDQATVRSEVGKGNAGGVSWSVAQHFPSK
ncbi:MAG: hypothetical protein ACM31P_07960 [Actinomycetota bacterium]